MISLGLGLWSTTILSRLGFSPSALFANGEVGVWYDPSDLSTLFQDTSGTTPVTTPGQTVALMLDNSGNDFHATQPTAAARPTYGIVPAGGRRNLLEYTEDLTNAAWTKFRSTITSNATTAPDGTTTADLVLDNATSGSHAVAQVVPNLIAGIKYVFSVYAKDYSGDRYLQIRPQGDGTGRGYVSVDLTDGSIVQEGGTNYDDAVVTPLDNGWYLIQLLGYVFSSIDGNEGLGLYLSNSPTSGESPSYAGNNTSGIYIWGAQLEAGSTATAYQKVTTQFDVTEAGVESLGYLSFDGVDDWMVTPTITPGIDKAQIFAGVRKLSDAAQAVITSFGDNTEDGSVETFAPRGTTTSFRFGTRSGGTVRTPAADASGSEFDAPITVVFTSLCSIPEDLLTLRIDGTQVAQSTADQGTGNYLTYPMYLGRRGGTLFPHNGQIFSLITRFGANLEVAQIESTEAYVAGKTAGVTL